jgi:hypothetical protein
MNTVAIQQAAQRRYDGLIKRKGGRGVLRQGGVDRPISVSVQQESSIERLGQASNPLDRVAYVSALDPVTGSPLDPIPSERDVIVVGDRRAPGGELLLKIIAPPDSMGAGDLTIYWRIKVRR